MAKTARSAGGKANSRSGSTRGTGKSSMGKSKTSNATAGSRSAGAKAKKASSGGKTAARASSGGTARGTTRTAGRNSGASSRGGTSRGANSRSGTKSGGTKAKAGGRSSSRSAGKSQTTTDHDEIRQWAESRGARPTCVRGTGGGGDVGMIRLDFPGYSGADSLEEVSWEEWFEKFDDNNLALVYQKETRGKASNFNKLVSRDNAKASKSGGNRSRSRAAGRR